LRPPSPRDATDSRLEPSVLGGRHLLEGYELRLKVYPDSPPTIERAVQMAAADDDDNDDEDGHGHIHGALARQRAGGGRPAGRT